ncbi:methyltransferase family protein [Mucilaginibacter gracilis]|uniref:Methyltransferase family protein n=1 Tax=Mucilaginibacter gracilis TaxID=423350 RepID=A0A495IZJ8_9SPHI|nr:class I SAM-dependent methyltransferase [Mucilaginibacter gracilis]RKR81444.1 methyltransferase family protein [Mucilaginibacter gracilis]
MTANYDNAAFFYDKLSRLVYGKALINAQLYLLKFVPPNSSVLIVGGGTGWILDELSAIHYSGLAITYVEVSAKMTALAQKRNTGLNKVVFINDAIENTPTAETFDVVITPFLFDNFTEETLEKVFQHIHSQLKPKGLWLCTDFKLTGPLWQKLLLKSMYVFFKILCGIETLKLPAIDKQFSKHGYKTIAAKTFYGKFIMSTIYQRQ